MAQFYEGGRDVYNGQVYSDPHPGTLRFLQNMVENTSERLTVAGHEFMSLAQGAYDKFHGSDVMRKTRAAINQISGAWQRNVISPIVTVSDLQIAPPIMHRWLMAEPNIRSLYHKQMCDGYGGLYIDANPNDIGEAHQDYRSVMNGIIVESEDGGWTSTQYFDDVHEDDKFLTSDEQFDILRSWAALATSVMVGGSDPTSRWNAEL